MISFYEAVYLSPHLDDAALSCGGQIYQRARAGESVLIVTIMAGNVPSSGLSVFAQGLHDRWMLPLDASSARREEDRAACQVLGADYMHLDLLDCIYRQDPESGVALYDSEDALFGDLHPAESSLVNRLAEVLAHLPESDGIYAPLTIGHHVDHQLTRLAAEAWQGSGNLTYYEEYPYVVSDDAMLEQLLKDGDWQSTTVKIADDALEARIRSIACYRSQLSTFFDDYEDMLGSIRRYVEGVGGERLWHHIAP